MTHLLTTLAHGVPCCGPSTIDMLQQAALVLGAVAAIGLAAVGVVALVREMRRG